MTPIARALSQVPCGYLSTSLILHGYIGRRALHVFRHIDLNKPTMLIMEDGSVEWLHHDRPNLRIVR